MIKQGSNREKETQRRTKKAKSGQKSDWNEQKLIAERSSNRSATQTRAIR